ncbi:MAG: protein ImuA [Alphaproteobacteria bacterium]|nr:protein ImuA [Alphaproteobacteria bacterium]
MSLYPARIERLDRLRAEVRAIEGVGAEGERPCLEFGIAPIDRRLAGGGLALSVLHEMAAAGPGLGDDAAASLFIAALASRLSALDRGATILWALGRRDLFAPALEQAGLPPDRLLYAECGREEDVLAVMEEGLRHGGLAAVVGEVGRAGMTATRRLQLAAEEGKTTALMLRRWRRSGEDPLGLPSAAVTRWRIGCVPSETLPAPGVGRPRWRLALARQRGGEPFEIIMEGPDAEGRLALPAEPQHRPHHTRAAA